MRLKLNKALRNRQKKFVENPWLKFRCFDENLSDNNLQRSDENLART